MQTRQLPRLFQSKGDVMRNLVSAHFCALFSFLAAFVVAGLTGMVGSFEFLLIWAVAAAVIGTIVTEGEAAGNRETIFFISLAYIGLLGTIVSVDEGAGWFAATIAAGLVIGGTVLAAMWEQRPRTSLALFILHATPVAGPVAYGMHTLLNRLPERIQLILGIVLTLCAFSGFGVLAIVIVG